MPTHANQKRVTQMTAQTETPETETEFGGELALTDEVLSEQITLTDAEKLDYVFRKFLEIDALLEQAGPLLEQAGPLLATFGGGQGSSPLGRIAGSLFR